MGIPYLRRPPEVSSYSNGPNTTLNDGPAWLSISGLRWYQKTPVISDFRVEVRMDANWIDRRSRTRLLLPACAPHSRKKETKYEDHHGKQHPSGYGSTAFGGRARRPSGSDRSGRTFQRIAARK